MDSCPVVIRGQLLQWEVLSDDMPGGLGVKYSHCRLLGQWNCEVIAGECHMLKVVNTFYA